MYSVYSFMQLILTLYQCESGTRQVFIYIVSFIIHLKIIKLKLQYPHPVAREQSRCDQTEVLGEGVLPERRSQSLGRQLFACFLRPLLSVGQADIRGFSLLQPWGRRQTRRKSSNKMKGVQLTDVLFSLQSSPRLLIRTEKGSWRSQC